MSIAAFTYPEWPKVSDPSVFSSVSARASNLFKLHNAGGYYKSIGLKFTVVYE